MPKKKELLLVKLVEWEAMRMLTVDEEIATVEEEKVADTVGGAVAAVEKEYNESNNEDHSWEWSIQVRI